MGAFIDLDLIITHGAVKEPVNPPAPKLVHARIVASWDWERPHSCNPIKSDVNHAEASFKLAYIMDIFLMGLGRQHSLGGPLAALNFIDVFHVH